MDFKDWKELLGLIDIPVKWLALGVGAWWTYTLFLKKRSKFPKANLAISARSWPLGDEYRLLRVSIVAANRGDVLLSLQQLRVWVQQIRPLDDDIGSLLAETGEVTAEGKKEAEWPMLSERVVDWVSGECEIEPGESQQFDFDFTLGASVETVVVYAFSVDRTRKLEDEIGWDAQTVVDLDAQDRGEAAVTHGGHAAPGVAAHLPPTTATREGPAAASSSASTAPIDAGAGEDAISRSTEPES